MCDEDCSISGLSLRQPRYWQPLARLLRCWQDADKQCKWVVRSDQIYVVIWSQPNIWADTNIWSENNPRARLLRCWQDADIHNIIGWSDHYTRYDCGVAGKFEAREQSKNLESFLLWSISTQSCPLSSNYLMVRFLQFGRKALFVIWMGLMFLE